MGRSVLSADELMAPSCFGRLQTTLEVPVQVDQVNVCERIASTLLQLSLSTVLDTAYA